MYDCFSSQKLKTCWQEITHIHTHTKKNLLGLTFDLYTLYCFQKVYLRVVAFCWSSKAKSCMLLKECCWVTFTGCDRHTSRKSRPCKSSSFPFTRHHVSYSFECLTLSRVSFVCVFGPSGIRWVFIMIFISSGLRSHRCVCLLSAITTVSVYQIFGSTLTLSSLYPRSCLTDESCLSYVNVYGASFDAEKCSKYCCGTCNLRYCCKDKTKWLNQESCSISSERCGLLFNLYFVMQMWVEIKAFFHVLFAVQAKSVWLWESP